MVPRKPERKKKNGLKIRGKKIHYAVSHYGLLSKGVDLHRRPFQFSHEIEIFLYPLILVYHFEITTINEYMFI